MILTAKDLKVSRNGQTILHNLSFDITPRTVTGLIGPNGSGKTTLLRTISGYLPYQGSIQLLNREIKHWQARALARKLAVVRQAPSLSFNFTVAEIVLLGLLPHKTLFQSTSRRDLDYLQTALKKVGLEGFARRRVHSLSGGEQQRVYLAQALLQNADMLLLDEPTTHLDVSNQYNFLHTARELIDQGRTIIVVFHDLELAARFADKLLVLHKGHLFTAGPPSSILNEALIRDVFRMHASIYVNVTGQTSITYQSAAEP